MSEHFTAIDFEVERLARQISTRLGTAYRPHSSDVPTGLYAFTLYYDRPAVEAAGSNDPQAYIRMDRLKIERILHLHLGLDWADDAVILARPSPAFLDDGTFAVPYLLTVPPEHDPWQGDASVVAETMIGTNAGIHACYLCGHPFSIQEAVREAVRGPSYDVNLLKGFARDADPALAHNILDLTGC